MEQQPEQNNFGNKRGATWLLLGFFGLIILLVVYQLLTS